MNSLIATTHSSSSLQRAFPQPKNFNLSLTLRKPHFLFSSSKFKIKPPHLIACYGSSSTPNQPVLQNDDVFHTEIRTPQVPSFASPLAKFSFSDQAFLLLAFITCTTSVAFASLAFAAVPTLFAMRKTALSLSRLADTLREELPSTMAAVRLSGMEISDLTLELSDLSQEIADGVSKSAQALQAAKAGIQQIGSVAQQQTISIIEERANLPKISVQPIVVGAARKTSRAVGRATKSLMSMISGKETTTENEDDLTLHVRGKTKKFS